MCDLTLEPARPPICRYLVDGRDHTEYGLPARAKMVLLTGPDRRIYHVSPH